MIYLLASIFFSTSIAVIFKIFPRYGIHLLSAIVVNYLVCYLCGVLILDVQLPTAYLNTKWWPFATGLGMFFIVGFNFVGKTVHEFGITTATLMQKMSIALSVLFAIIYFGESTNTIKLIGISLAIASILIFNSGGAHWKGERSHLYIPFMTWLISGCIEIGLLYPQKMGLIQGQDAEFVSIIFLCAGILGLLYAVFSKQIKALVNRKNVIAGIALGVPNFFSMYYLVLLLGLEWDASISLPINNVGILVGSGIVGWLIFKEKYVLIQWLGLLMAIFAIIALALSV